MKLGDPNKRYSNLNMPASLETPTVRRSLLDLATETRLHIYESLLDYKRVTVEADLDLTSTRPVQDCLSRGDFIRPSHRSGQILRTCKQILNEARPVLHKNTIFVVNRLASPDTLPYTIKASPSFGQMRHLEIDMALQDLHSTLVWNVQGESYVDWLHSLKITCTSQSWINATGARAIRWAGHQLSTYEDVHEEARRFMVDMWLDAGFTYFEDKSVENEELEFYLSRDRATAELKQDGRIRLARIR